MSQKRKNAKPRSLGEQRRLYKDRPGLFMESHEDRVGVWSPSSVWWETTHEFCVAGNNTCSDQFTQAVLGTEECQVGSLRLLIHSVTTGWTRAVAGLRFRTCGHTEYRV